MALQALYEVDIASHTTGVVVERLLGEATLSEDNTKFVRDLVMGVVKERNRIDEKISQFAAAWPIEQISIIDRNILRLAIFEILYNNSIPIKVIISEAVELAKLFGSDNSSKFVNGVLGSVSALTDEQRNV